MDYDVIIIGAGQAGLSMGYYLQTTNLSFLIIDKNRYIGDVWRKRYDSLTLFTPRHYNSLPGLTMQGNQHTYPTKDEIANYLSTYAKHFSLPIQMNTDVQGLAQVENGFTLFTSDGELRTNNVVIATGPFQRPFTPAFSNNLSQHVLQIHTSKYKNAGQLNEGPTLVVGGGNSGAQIAVELAKERKVFLSVGHKLKFFPQDIGNRSIFWWFDKLGILKANIHSKVGQFLKRRPDPIFGYDLKSKLKNKEIILKQRTSAIDNNIIRFDDESTLKVNNVIWATGYHSDYSWIHIFDVLNEKGIPIHQRGVTSIEGLYFLGLPWQYRRSSALLQGVGTDAKYLLSHIQLPTH